MDEFTFNIQVAVPEDKAADFFADADANGVLPAVQRAIGSGDATIYLDPKLDPETVIEGVRERVGDSP